MMQGLWRYLALVSAFPGSLAFVSPIVHRHSLRAPAALASGTTDIADMYKGAFEFYDAWNRGDIDSAMTYFSEGVVFHDMLNKEPFRGRAPLRKYLQECYDAMPGWTFVIDEYAWDAGQQKLGLRWHVEDGEGRPLLIPARGLSFLTFDEAGLIKENTDIPEPTVKAGPMQLPLLKAVSTVLGLKRKK